MKRPPVLVLLVLMVLTLASLTSNARAQVPVGCSDRWSEIQSYRSSKAPGTVADDWRLFEDAVRRARPGSARYAPHPYPKDDREVLDDALYAIEHVIAEGSSPDELTPGVIAVLEAADSDRLRIDVRRVENWSPTRCSTERPKPFYFLVRFLSEDGRGELGRMALHDTGLLARFRPYPSPVPGHTLPTSEEVHDLIGAVHGASAAVTSLRLITLEGLEGCSPLDPCPAFDIDGRLHVLEQGPRLFEIQFPAKVTSVTEHRTALAAKLPALGADHTAPMVSIGFAWSPALRVPLSSEISD